MFNSDLRKILFSLTHSYKPKERVKKEELPRMLKVLASFKVIIGIEIVLIVISVVLLLVVRTDVLSKRIFTGLLLLIPFLLIFDVIAKSRDKIYLEYLNILNGN